MRFESYKNVAVVFANHENDSFRFGKIGVMNQGQTFGCVFVESLIIDERGEMCLITGELHDEKFVPLFSRKRK